MASAPEPENEPARLAALRSYQVLDTNAEEAFDALTRAAALICGTPIAVISLVDQNRQWFKSVVGLDCTETPRELAFCAHAIHDQAIFEVPDALQDVRFADNALVTGDPNIRFYAGAPLIVPGDFALGTLCVIDRAPRELTAQQRLALTALSVAVGHLLAGRKADVEAAKRLNAVIAAQARLADAELDLNSFLDAVLSQLSTITPAVGGALVLIDGDQLVVRAGSGTAAYSEGVRFNRDSSLCGLCANTGKIMISEDCWTDPRIDPKTLSYTRARSAVAAPLFRNGDIFACVMLLAAEPCAFGPADSRTLELMGGVISAAFEHRVRIDANRTLLAERGLALEALTEVQDRFRSAMIHSATGMALVTPDERWLEVNEAFCLFVGYSREELKHLPFRTLTHPDFYDQSEPAFLQLINGEIDTYQVEKCYVHKSGAPVWGLLAVSMARNAEGAPQYFIAQVTDITARKRAEDAERRTAQRLIDANRFLIMGETMARVGHWRVDCSTQKQHWSDEVFRIYGLSPEDGEPTMEAAIAAYHPDDHAKVTAVVDAALENGENFSAEFRLIRADGAVRDVATWGQCERAPDGSIINIFGVFQDITGQKDTQRELAQLNERFILATQAAKVGIWEWRIAENELHCDDTNRRLYGLSPAETPISAADWLGLMVPDDAKKFDAELRACLRGERAYDLEYRVIWPNGQIRYLQSRAILVKDAHGAPIRMVGTNWDVTEIRTLTLQLAAEKERAEQANEAKSNFLATMSHEIRTPMNGIMGMNALLLDTELKPHQRRLAETVRQSADALLTIIDDILDVSKLEAGKIDLEEIDFDFPALITAVADLLSGPAEQKGLALNLDIAALDRNVFHGDPTRLRQIVLNLVSNAIKFTEQGSVTIKLSGTPQADEKTLVRIDVQDTGIGISEETKHRLFKPFEQADNSITRRFGGTGLGLNICKKLAELMGGDIGVMDRPGGGSIFWVEIALPPASSLVDAELSGDDDVVVPDPAHSGRILLAEDHPINIQLATLILEGAGYTVDVATDGLEAVAAARGYDYDLILMDVQMPKLDGLSATREIRLREGSANRVPIVAMTANAMMDDQRLCLESGMNDFIAKPISPPKLLETVARWILESARSPDETQTSPDGASAMKQIDAAQIASLRSLIPDTTFTALVQLYLTEADSQARRLAELRDTLSFDAIRSEAHNAIATAGNFGAKQVQEVASRLQTACRAGDAQVVPGLIDQLIDLSDAASVELRQILAVDLQPALSMAG